MKRIPITVTEAAKRFSACVDRVHKENVAFVLLRNGAPFAQLSPIHEKVCRGRDLVKVLEKLELHAEEAKAWGHDLRAARKVLKAPNDRWR